MDVRNNALCVYVGVYILLMNVHVKNSNTR